jgi:hypothetical protein
LSTGSYSNPSWLTSIQGSIVSGNIGGNAAGITGSIATSQVSNLASWTGSTAIATVGTISAGTWQGAVVGTSYGGTGRTSIGTADQLLGVNHTGGALEYKSLTAGSNITITPGSGSITIASNSGTPGGSNTQIQYNNGGAFAGSANLTFDGTNLACGGNVSVSGSNPLIQTSSSGLKIRQTGDTLGETGLILENRNGANGAVFYNNGAGTNLVDFQFQNQNTYNCSLRTEGRSAFMLGNGNNVAGYSEIQLLQSAGGTPCVGGIFGYGSIVLCPSNSFAPMGNPRVGIWQTNPGAMLHVQASSSNRTGAIVQGAISQTSDLTLRQEARKRRTATSVKPLVGTMRVRIPSGRAGLAAESESCAVAGDLHSEA